MLEMSKESKRSDKMEYIYKIIEIDELKEGDIVDIPDGSLILSAKRFISNTTQCVEQVHSGRVPDKPKWRTSIDILIRK